MASQKIPQSCIRCLRVSQQPVTPSLAGRTFQRNFHSPAPLQLDFLAPSWTATGAQPLSRRVMTLYKKSAVSNAPRIRRLATATTTANDTSTSSATPPPPGASSPPPARAIANPRFDDAGNPLQITITARAAHRLQAIAATDGNPELALRVSVESGGCHGFQYLMSLTSLSEADGQEDTVFESERRVGAGADANGQGEAYRAKVVMDEASLDLLKGSSVDYTMELIGSQFKVTGIPGAKSSCGCGTSFDIAMD